MIIAVTQDLPEINKQLKVKGYDVVTLGNYKYPIDVMIYNMYSPEAQYITNNNIPNGEQFGILMINAKNKTIEQIEGIIKSRLYSPLF